MKEVMDFISNNQLLIMTVIVCLTWIANRIVSYLASKPKQDIWDDIQPYSQKACDLIFDGVEAYAKYKGIKGADKLQSYINRLKIFSDEWQKDRLLAVANLYAWYRAEKEPHQGELTADTVAEE